MDLDKITAVHNLDNVLALEMFVGKFTVKMKKAYVKHVLDAEMRMKKGSEIMNLHVGGEEESTDARTLQRSWR